MTMAVAAAHDLDTEEGLKAAIKALEPDFKGLMDCRGP